MKRWFCSCFDHNYMIYGLTMFRSLAETGIDFQLFVLCLSDEAFDKLSNFDERLTPIRLQELEEYDPELKACEQSRSRVEYIFTISPCLPLFLFDKFSHIDLLTYLDADLYFFHSPECLYEELGNKSLYIIEHRFAENASEQIEAAGRFNVAFQIYRNNPVAKKCLENWRTECLAWCYDISEDGKFADQKYLDLWPDRCAGEVVISQNIGADVAPWNIDNYRCEFQEGCLLTDNRPAVFFHYQGFRMISNCFGMWLPYLVNKKSYHIFRKLGRAYLRELKETAWKYKNIFANWTPVLPLRVNCINVLNCPRIEPFLRLVPSFNLKMFFRWGYMHLRRIEGLFFVPERKWRIK